MTDEPAAEVFARTAANRRRIADLADSLDESELDTPSLCAGWATRDVLGHLVMALDLSVPRFLLAVLRDAGRAARTSERVARLYGARPVGELVAALRGHADDEVAPPGIGALGPFSDSCIHLRDIAVPLGRDDTAPLDDWRLVLDFLTTRRARTAGFVAGGRLDGLRLVATDLPEAWSSGGGAEVAGPAAPLALAMSGRAVGLVDLHGPGVEVLAARL